MMQRTLVQRLFVIAGIHLGENEPRIAGDLAEYVVQHPASHNIVPSDYVNDSERYRKLFIDNLSSSRNKIGRILAGLGLTASAPQGTPPGRA